MKQKLFFSNCLLFFILFISLTANSKNLYGGIEIGSKGIKMTVIDVTNEKKGLYDVIEFWTENVGIAKGISIDGNLAKADLDVATVVVFNNYKKLLEEFQIPNDQIFIVASSGVGMAKNTDELKASIKKITNKEIEIISSSLEAKLLLKGCIPPKLYMDSMILDIGGGNTKGGYVDLYNVDKMVFIPIALDLGTITLTEKINKKSRDKDEPIFEYNENMFNYLPTLRDEVNNMFEKRPVSLTKENIYLSGGAVWAIYTLINSSAADENYSPMYYEQIVYTKSVIENNFKRISDLSETNKQVKNVLNVYSQKHLITAANLLTSILDDIPNLNEKKLYFAKQGQIAWLLAYIADNTKGAKYVY